MKIARIVSSNSHLDYVARVIDSLDTDTPPEEGDYGFAQFVSIKLETENMIGIIHNSMLINPEYANYGPRLSPKPDTLNFTPDFINEQGVLIGVLLLGAIRNDGRIDHGVPRSVIPPGQDVETLDNATLKKFHLDKNRDLQIHYYSQVISHASAFALPLLEAIISELTAVSSETDLSRLNVLKQSLAWQRTVGIMRL